MAPLMATALGFILLTANSILAIHRSWGDAAATIFVIASYASLVLLFYFLRLFETAPPASPAAKKLGFGALILNSALAIYNSWDDAGSVAFVLVAVAALLLLVLRLREFEMATVWALTTLLTAMFAWRVAPIMPLAVRRPRLPLPPRIRSGLRRGRRRQHLLANLLPPCVKHSRGRRRRLCPLL